MSTGCLIYATDGDIEYSRIAKECARRVNQHLGIPSTILSGGTNTTGNRAWADCDKPIAWRNSGRCNALHDSPYDRTLLLDADFWINSDVLKTALDSNASFLAHNTRMYVNEKYPVIETFGTLKTPMWWATVCVFDRSDFPQDVFASWRMIEENYKHYSELFQFNRKPFRNDFALSLALLLCNGNTQPTQCALPWPLINVPDSAGVDYKNDTWNLNYTAYEHQQTLTKRITIKDQDLHIMGKRSLEKLCEIH